MEAGPSAGTPTPKTPRGSTKARPTGTHSGFRYEVGNPRKNGSEVWKCVDKDCKASVIKKGDSFSQTKEHTVGGATLQTTLQHVTMTLMRDRALKFPEESPAQIIHNITTAVRDLVLATVPPASTLERTITEWRQQLEQGKGKKKGVRAGSSTPKNKSMKGESSRKRLKMTPKRKKDDDSEDGEAELEELEKLEDELGGDQDEGEDDELEYLDDDEDEADQTVPETKKRPRQVLSDEDSEEDK